MRSIYRVLTLVLVALCLASCTKVNSGVVGMFNLDTDLKLVLIAGKDINPDEKHSPSPLFIRFYELTSDQAFNKADFLELYEKDEKLLGKDLIARRELNRLVPSEIQEETFVLDPKTRYVALFAEFYEYQNSKYKLVFPVTSANVIKNTVRVEVTGNQMLLKSAR
ncbi:type VI secretion system lipoprotein TssJ [Saccharophagus sp. K07]|uniref:type VI secretion system lipoprotein TssJ n=1 Tax=Saccharophagus sp. K07 TaxID=2283636 RepID=UPI001651D6BE